MLVYLGEYNRKEIFSPSRLKCEVESIFLHEYYKNLAIDNPHDIAIIKLKKQIPINDDYYPICLPPLDMKIEGKNGYVIG